MRSVQNLMPVLHMALLSLIWSVAHVNPWVPVPDSKLFRLAIQTRYNPKPHEYYTLLFSSLLFATLLYSSLLFSSLLYSTMLYSTLLYHGRKEPLDLRLRGGRSTEASGWQIRLSTFYHLQSLESLVFLEALRSC